MGKGAGLRRIHIVGLNPRTGTTLLAECLRLCFRIDRAEEHEASLFRLRRCIGVYLTKNPRDIELVGARLRLDPRFHVICMARDPRDVAVRRHGKRPDDYWDKTSLGQFRRRWATARQLLEHPRFMLVRFEDLISRPDDVQREIASRFPFLVETAKFSSFHERGQISEGSSLAMNGVRPIDAGNKSKWPDHIDRLRRQLQEHGSISREMVDLGYEPDDAWMAAHGIASTPPAARPRRQGGRRIGRRLANTGAAVLTGAFARLGIPIG